MTSQKVELVKGVGWHVQKEKVKNVHLLKISQSHSNFQGVILTPKRSLKNSFSGVKITPDIEELK